MCIIIAKKAGVQMPSMDTLRNCFNNNPDGAGFMLAAKNRVYGFKGLMTFEEVSAELAKAEKRFGCLDKHAVVLHFRIGTHGSNIAGNTHPFPLYGGYRELRLTEWQARQGFAHNGIISLTSSDKDIEKHNVSDTMIFAKKFIIPIARHATIANDPALADMLHELAKSKLCFLSSKGTILTRGDFIERDGVLYSNGSFKDDYAKPSYYDDYGLWKAWGYEYPPRFEKDDDWDVRLPEYEIREVADEIAEEDYDAVRLPEGTIIRFNQNTSYTAAEDSLMYIDSYGIIWCFNRRDLDFDLWLEAKDYEAIIYPDDEEEV